MTSTEITSTAKRARSIMPDTLDSPRKIIENIVRAHQFDYDAATEALLEEMDENAALREYVEAEGARYCVRLVAGGSRRSSSVMADVSVAAPTSPGQPFRRHYRAIVTFLDDFTLPGGMSIGDARAADIKRAIEYYGAQEAGMRKQRKFLEAVGKKLAAGKRVREVFSAAQLMRMQREAR